MNDKLHPDIPSKGEALVSLALKLGLGKRGEYLAEYLEIQRSQRTSHRLTILGEAAADAGLSADVLLQRVTNDDDAAELLDQVIDTAKASRYEPKVAYLGRCLAAAIATEDAPAIDTAWLRIGAVTDLDAIHVRLLHGIRGAQIQRADERPRLPSLETSDIPVTEKAITDVSGLGLPGTSAFHTVMAALIRNGLVAVAQAVDLDVELDIDFDDQTFDGDQSATSSTVYVLTLLGLEVLDELYASGQSDHTRP